MPIFYIKTSYVEPLHRCRRDYTELKDKSKFEKIMKNR